MCFFRSLLFANLLSQPSNSHWNGFSPAGGEEETQINPFFLCDKYLQQWVVHFLCKIKMENFMLSSYKKKNQNNYGNIRIFFSLLKMRLGVAFVLVSINNAHSHSEGVGEEDRTVLRRPTEGLPFAGRQ